MCSLRFLSCDGGWYMVDMEGGKKYVIWITSVRNDRALTSLRRRQATKPTKEVVRNTCS